jgi:hypothetical protein
LAWPILPFELPLIGFERFDNNPRYYGMDTLRRLTVSQHDESLQEVAGVRV